MEIELHTALPRPAAPPRPNDAAFDAWLRRQLNAAHDRVLHEPIPERLLQVLKKSSAD
jgi:hypothetical protein